MNNIMLDLETLSTRHDAMIISIGAVMFDKDGLGDIFYRVIDNTNNPYGFHMDPATVSFWMRQEYPARLPFFSTSGDPNIETVLSSFAGLCDLAGGHHNVKIWGNGATFDNVILSNAYERVGIEHPWSHRGDRCYRTLKNFSSVECPQVGTLHNALDDAKAQALHLIEIAKDLNLEL